MEFKFDDTRLSYWHKNKIGRIEIFFGCFLTLLILCPVGCLSKTEQAKLSKPTGQKISKVRKQQKKFQFCQSYSYVNSKVWYHKIWIPNNLGFMVLILMYIQTTEYILWFKFELQNTFYKTCHFSIKYEKYLTPNFWRGYKAMQRIQGHI